MEQEHKARPLLQVRAGIPHLPAGSQVSMHCKLVRTLPGLCIRLGVSTVLGRSAGHMYAKDWETKTCPGSVPFLTRPGDPQRHLSLSRYLPRAVFKDRDMIGGHGHAGHSDYEFSSKQQYAEFTHLLLEK